MGNDSHECIYNNNVRYNTKLEGYTTWMSYKNELAVMLKNAHF